MIKVKLGEIFVAQNVLPKLLTENLKIKTHINIERLFNKLNSELQFIEKQRIELVKKYGTQINETEYQVAEDKIIEFNSELMEFFDTEIEISEVDKIDVDEIEHIILNEIEYKQLRPFIKF